MQGGGTFDASGAFRDERWSDEDDGAEERKEVSNSGDHHHHQRDDEAEPHGAGVDDESAHQFDDAEVKVVGAAEVSKEASIELSDGGNSLLGEPALTASPARSVSDQIEEQPTVMERESGGPAIAIVDHPEHHGRTCEEDGLEHAQAVASTLVAQLVEDEDHPKEVAPPNHHGPVTDQWFYR